MVKGRFRSIFAVILCFVLLSLVMILGVNEIYIRKASNEMEEKLLADLSNNVHYISEALDDQWQDIRRVNFDLMTFSAVMELTMQKSILDQYGITEREIETMKYIRSRITQNELIGSVSIYLPAVESVITESSAIVVDQDTVSRLWSIIDEYPGGVFASEGKLGFWNTYPTTIGTTLPETSRISVTEIRPLKLKSLLESYKVRMPECELMLFLNDQLLAATFSAEWVSADDQHDSGVRLVGHEGKSYYLSSDDMQEHGLTVCALLPKDEIMSGMYSLRHNMRVIQVIGMVLLIAGTILLFHILIRPLREMTAVMDKVGTGDLSARMPAQWSREFSQLSDQFNSMTEKLSTLIRQEYETRLLYTQSEMKQLQNQISPHFLYNTYFQLRNLILIEDDENAERLADLMGEFLKYTVHSDQTTASLNDELEHAKVYTDIQEMRFQNKVRVLYDLPGVIEPNPDVPRLIFQPLVENAFGHGVKNRDGGGLIRISLTETADRIEFAVEDNGTELTDTMLAEITEEVGQPDNTVRGGIALKNIHRRLCLTFGGDSGLRISRSEFGGMKAAIVICIPKEGAEHGQTAAGGR